MTPWTHKSGHLYVSFQKDGAAHRRQVHRLVLESFVGPCPPGRECLHGDGVPTNNALANLRWGTRTENQLDIGRHHGGWSWRPHESGVTRYNARFDENDIRCIRAEPKFHGVNKMLAKCYSVAVETIKRVRQGRSYVEVRG